MERNDLIERLRDFGGFGNGTTNDAMNLCNEAAATIASLSEALAEAEKKGAEAVAEICEVMADEDDVLAMREGLEYWEIFQHRCAERRLRHAAKVARDLSQGGQHG